MNQQEITETTHTHEPVVEKTTRKVAKTSDKNLDPFKESFDKSPHRKEIEKLMKKVVGRFKFNEVPGGTLEFFCQGKFRGMPLKYYSMVDNYIYEVPYFVAEHLNNSGTYPIHEHQVDGNGQPIIGLKEKVRRYDFYVINDVTPNDMSVINPEIKAKKRRGK